MSTPNTARARLHAALGARHAPRMGWRCSGFLCLIAVAQACGNPCDDLTKKICSCEPTSNTQRLCEQNAQEEANYDSANHTQQNTCSDLLDTCSCAELARGELAACGLARP